MKYKNPINIKEENDSGSGSAGGASSSCSSSVNATGKEGKRKSKLNADKRFCVIQCTGYLKSWAPTNGKMSPDESQRDQETESEGESCNLSCLVAVGRIPPNVFAQPNNAGSANMTPKTVMFLSRHALDGQFLFVDQRATLLVGFLPQELLSTNMYEYFHQEDISSLAEVHKRALQAGEMIKTDVYRMRTKDGSFVRVQSEWRGFRNPWTKEVEYMYAKNHVFM